MKALYKPLHEQERYSVQFTGQTVRPVQDIERSAEVYRQVFAKRGMRLDETTRSAISRAKNGGTNPIATLKAHLRKHRHAGGTYAQARLVAEDMDAFIDSLYATDLDCSDSAIRRASMRETEREGVANIAQLALHECSARSTLVDVLDKLTAEEAEIHALRVKLIRRIEIEG